MPYLTSFLILAAIAPASAGVNDEHESFIRDQLALGLACGQVARRLERVDAGWSCELVGSEHALRSANACLIAMNRGCDDVGGDDADGDGWTVDEGDCDDTDDSVNPDGEEVCDGVDNDCDGYRDGGLIQRYYLDQDGDGFGQPGTTVLTCAPAEDYAPLAGDCDDTDDSVHPRAEDTCWEDKDCDGEAGDFGFDVPGDYATVQSALDAADDGDHICVTAGDYEETLTISAGVTLEGEGADLVTLYGMGDDSTITVADNVTGLVFKGFTVTGGVADYGAGINGDRVAATLEELIVEDNYCENSSGSCEGVGISFFRSELVIRNVSVKDNYGESVYSWGAAIQVPYSTVTMENVDVRSNYAAVETYAYGMINAYDSDVTLTNVIIAGNSFGDYDGDERDLYGVGLNCYAGSTCVLENVTIHGNGMDAGNGATYGAIHANAEDTLIATNVTVTNNDGEGGGGVVSGWDIHADSATLTYCNTYENSVDWGTDFSDPVGADGNLSVEPDFVNDSGNARGWDLTLTEDSSLIDAGDPGIVDPDWSTSDIGAYGGPLGDW